MSQDVESADAPAPGALKAWFQRLGILLATIFYVVSTIVAINNHGGMGALVTGDTKIITFAHWQLEDGFREGFDLAIAEYEKAKAEQGIKVQVRQVAIPVRGYAQWFMTQLIGGDPADVVELSGSSDLHNQYLTALSPYIGHKNPWNKGTPLEDYVWRETFVDDMLSAFDLSYSEYFGACIFMHTTRMYVNMTLYEAATGTKIPPRTVSEWIESCQKIRKYGEETKRPVIPIGVRGFDKGTLGQLLNTYNSQLNGDLSETGNPNGYGVAAGELLRQLNDGELPKGKILRVYDLVNEIGQYFAEGFPAIDLEQTKFLFASGNVAFFIDGTYNAWSLVNNAEFPVEVVRLPQLDDKHPLGKDAMGPASELGAGIGGRFGIAKKTRNFDLALDFLQFITSHRINQMTMVEHCKWMSSLKHVQYEGLMKTFEPILNTTHIAVPMTLHIGTYGGRQALQWAERSIIDNDPNPGRAFWNRFVGDRAKLIEEQSETAIGIQRQLWNMDATRSAVVAGLRRSPGPEVEELLRLRANITLEGVVSRMRALDNQYDVIREIGRMKPMNGEDDNGKGGANGR